jgi:hypothetical protein
MGQLFDNQDRRGLFAAFEQAHVIPVDPGRLGKQCVMSTTNQGTLGAENGGALNLPGSTLNAGQLHAGVGSTINVLGTFTNSNSGTLVSDIAGAGAGQYGVINVSGTAVLAGTFVETVSKPL